MLSHRCHFSATALFAGVIALSLSQPLFSGSIFLQTNLTSDGFVPAANTDPNLRNPWGISFGPTTPFWISDQAAGLSTLYTGTGAPVTALNHGAGVIIPAGGGPPSGPTGTVFNSGASTSFLLPTSSGGTVRSSFLFDTLSGAIEGWNPGSSGGAASALIVASKAGAVYTGLTMGSSGGSDYLYAANNAGSVDVYDSSFKDVSGTTFAGKFVDPAALAGFTPFNVQNVGGQLYVTYASITPAGTPKPGGYVDVFTTSGNFVKRLATGGVLDAPWGVAQAPAGFGMFGGDILVGNFFPGGTINAFDPMTGAFAGTLSGANGQPIMNDFLWGLDFGNGGAGFNSNTLYITAGLNNQMDGVFASIQSIPEPGTLLLCAIGFAWVGARRRR